MSWINDLFLMVNQLKRFSHYTPNQKKEQVDELPDGPTYYDLFFYTKRFQSHHSSPMFKAKL